MKKILQMLLLIGLVACQKEYPIESNINEIEIQAGKAFNPSDYFAFKNGDGEDISDKITYVGDLNTSKLGKYKIKIKINIDQKIYTKRLTVHVIDTMPPALELTQPYFYSIIGTPFDPLKAVISISDNYGEPVTIDQIEVTDEYLENSYILHEEVTVPTHQMTFKVKDQLGNETVKELTGFEVYPTRYINNSPYTLEQYVQPIYDHAYNLGYQILILRPFDYNVRVVLSVEEAKAVLESHQGSKIMSLYTDDIQSSNGIALFLGK